MMKPNDTASGLSGSMGAARRDSDMDGELQCITVSVATVQFYKHHQHQTIHEHNTWSLE